MIVDIVIVLVLAAALAAGYQVGFVQRILVWCGVGAGLALGVWMLPPLVRRAADASATARLAIVLGVLLVLATIGAALGEILGRRVHRVVSHGVLQIVDRLAGAATSAFGVVVVLWVLLPVLTGVPGDVARFTRDSAIMRAIEREAPRAPDVAQTLRALVGGDGFPEVFDALRAAPDVGAPPAAVAVPPAVLQAAIASTVKIESQGCGVTRDGSGFTVAPGVVVTNAHVVAGATRIDAFEPNGVRRSASIVVFDDNRDLAVLSVANLDERPLAIAEPAVGTEGAVLGHPEGQDPVRAAPAAVREQILAVGRDIYGDDVTTRDVLVLAASLAPGDSGAAMVDASGRVVGVAFAVAPDRSATAYALADSELHAVLGAPRVAGSGGACM